MSGLARLSLANRAVVALVAMLIAGVGLFSMLNLKQELIPSISIPVISVITTAPGASPDVVDEQISKPLSAALKNVEGVESITSASSSSVSSITVQTTFGLDQNELKAAIQAGIDSAQASLPADSAPRVVTGSLADLPVMSLTASSDASLEKLATQLQSTVIPDLQAIDGVREVTLSGVDTQQLTITPDAAAMATARLSSQDISDALEANGVTIPVGSITDAGVSVPVQGGTPVTSIEDIGNLPLAISAADGAPITIGSIASVAVVTDPPTSITRTNGVASLALSITALPDGDLVGISHAVTGEIPDLEATVGSNASITTVFDQAPFIEESIQHLAIEGLLGLVFAIIVILIFLLSVRSTIVTAVSIPLSILVTFIGLNLGGFSLNMLTLGALTIAIGRVVDDSIVVIENIKRQLSYGKEKTDAILTGVKEVAGAITASTLTTIMVFLPIALVGGVVGELFRPFAVTVAIAMASSLVVALTIVPVLAYWFLKAPAGDTDPVAAHAAAEEKETRGILQRVYLPVLRATQKRPVVTVVASALLLVLTVSLVPLLKVDFLGASGQNTLSVTQTFAAGTELNSISNSAAETERVILDTAGVTDVQLTAGASTGGLGSLMGGGNGDATFQITTDKTADQAVIQSDLAAGIKELPASADITIGAASSGGLGASTVDVVITAGDDELALTSAADQVAKALEDTPNVSEVTSDRQADQPTFQIAVDRTAALTAGLTELQVTGIVAAQLTPSSVGSIRINGADLDIFIDNGSTPTTIDQLEQLILPTATGLLPLTDLATVERVSVPSTVSRDGGDLVATISLTPDEGELGAVTASVQERIDDLDLPSGASVSLGGASSQQTDAFSQLGLAMVIAIAIVYLLMVATFRSLMQPLILLVSIPFAATGAIALLLVTGRPLGVASLIGLLMLIGIVVTNAIVLIDLVNQYRKQGQSVADAVTNGARQRLRPILMTALATIFALTPMALGITGSSGFISQDLAIVVIGGLVSSTALTLILVPVLYRLFEGRHERRAHKHLATATEGTKRMK